MERVLYVSIIYFVNEKIGFSFYFVFILPIGEISWNLNFERIFSKLNMGEIYLYLWKNLEFTFCFWVIFSSRLIEFCSILDYAILSQNLWRWKISFLFSVIS